MSYSFMKRLETEPFALLFSGQSTPWTNTLYDVSNNARVYDRVKKALDSSEALIAPVAADALAIAGRRIDVLSYASESPVLGSAAQAQISVPGIATAQLGTILDMIDLGLDVNAESLVSVKGHSQGVLAVELVEVLKLAQSGQLGDDKRDAAVASILAIARLIGLAAARTARNVQMNSASSATEMLSIKGATREQIEALIARVSNARGAISVAVKNSPTHWVISGYPADLQAVFTEAEREHEHQNALRESKVRGGSVFDPQMEYLEVSVPFHSPMMAEAVEQVAAWAGVAGLDAEYARRLAQQVLVDPVDWVADINEIMHAEGVDAAQLWLVDMDQAPLLAS